MRSPPGGAGPATANASNRVGLTVNDRPVDAYPRPRDLPAHREAGERGDDVVVASRRRCIRKLALPTDTIVSSDASVGPRTVTSGEKQQSSDYRTSIDEHTPRGSVRLCVERVDALPFG